MNKNKFRDKYSKNNDLFIHVRLGDVLNLTDNDQTLQYYEQTICKIKYDKGYITSDSIDHSICTHLITKYNLTVINNNEIETIMFGSVCKHIILSGGTFSWMIGVLAFYAETIYYPIIDEKLKWYGDIFTHPKWIASS